MLTTFEKPCFRAMTRIIGVIVFSWCASWCHVGLAQSAETAEVTAPEAALARSSVKADEDHPKPEVSQSAGEKTAGAHDLRGEKAPKFAFSAEKTKAIAECLWSARWVKQYSWLVIGDAGTSGEWRFRVFPVASRVPRVVGEGVVRFAEDETVTASLSLPRGETDYTVVGFDATVNEEWFDVRTEAASLAVKGAFKPLLPVDSAKDISYAWVFRKKDAKRWPLCFVEFVDSMALPGYGEVESDTLMVLLYPVRESTREREESQSSDENGGGAPEAEPAKKTEFPISAEQVAAIARCLWIDRWVKDDSWLVVGDAGGDQQWAFRVLSGTGGEGAEIGEGELQFMEANRIGISMGLAAGDKDYFLEGFEPSINEEWYDVPEEAASAALRETFKQLLPADSSRKIVYAWVFRKPDAERWRIEVHWFMGYRVMPVYAEIDADGTMVLIFPAVMM